MDRFGQEHGHVWLGMDGYVKVSSVLSGMQRHRQGKTSEGVFETLQREQYSFKS